MCSASKPASDGRADGRIKRHQFDPVAFLASSGIGRRVISLKNNQALFSQGDPSDAVFFLQKGRVKLTVVSKAGKEATITLLAAGDFVGEEAIAAVVGLRMASATAITHCTALRIERIEMIRGMREEQDFSELFVAFLLARSMRTQADLVDQLFNSSEKRLARILLLMAEFGKPDQPEMLLPKISQETLAELIGITRSRGPLSAAAGARPSEDRRPSHTKSAWHSRVILIPDVATSVDVRSADVRGCYIAHHVYQGRVRAARAESA